MIFKSCLELFTCLSGVDKLAVLTPQLVYTTALIFLAFFVLFLCFYSDFSDAIFGL